MGGFESQILVEEESNLQHIFAVLDDRDCREILQVTSDEKLSATEVADMCEMPLSTTYRKIDMLDQAGFLDEHTRIHRWGKHSSAYSRSVESVFVSLRGDGSAVVQVSHRCSPTVTSRHG